MDLDPIERTANILMSKLNKYARILYNLKIKMHKVMF